MAAPYTQGGRRGHESGFYLGFLSPGLGYREWCRPLCHGSSLQRSPSGPDSRGGPAFPPRVCTAGGSLGSSPGLKCAGCMARSHTFHAWDSTRLRLLQKEPPWGLGGLS